MIISTFYYQFIKYKFLIKIYFLDIKNITQNKKGNVTSRFIRLDDAINHWRLHNENCQFGRDCANATVDIS